MRRQLPGRSPKITAGGSIAFASKLDQLVEFDCRQRQIGLLDGAFDQISGLDAATLVPEVFRASRHYQRASASGIRHLTMIARTLRPSFISDARFCPSDNLMRHDPCAESAVSAPLLQELFITWYLGTRLDFLSDRIRFPSNNLE
jgi:hypothetical protein